MMRTRAAFLFLCTILLASITYAQSKGELLNAIAKSKPDTGRVRMLLTLGRFFLSKGRIEKKDLDSSLEYMTKAARLSRDLNYVKGQGHCLLLSAVIYNKKGDKVKGLALSFQALNLFTKMNDFEDIAESNIVIGQHYGDDGKDLSLKIGFYKKAVAIFRQTALRERTATTLVELADYEIIQDSLTDAMRNLHSALSIYQLINNNKKLQKLYDLMGFDFTIMGDRLNGLKYELMALKSAQTLNDTSLQLCTIYNRLGLAYYYLRNYRQAIKYYDQALIVANRYRDTASCATIMLNQADVLNRLNKPAVSLTLLNKVLGTGYFQDDTSTMKVIYREVLDIYLQNKQFKQARLYLNKIERYRTDSKVFDHANLTAHIHYFLAAGQFNRCYPYLIKINNHYEKERSLRPLSINHLLWFKADSSLGKYASAIKHYQAYKMLNDSLYTLASNKQAQALQIEFETEKKDKDLAILRKQSESQVQKTRSARNIMVGSCSAFILVLGIGYNRFRLKQRTNRLLKQKQSEINEQYEALQNLLMEKENLLTDKERLLYEKDWLLKEVHHRVKNNLQIVMSLLNTQSAFLENKSAINAFRESQNRVQSISLIHQKLYNSDNASTINVTAYVSDLLLHLGECYGAGKRRIRIEQKIENGIVLDVSQIVPLGLILNEAVTNAMKYAFGPEGGEMIIALHRKKGNKLDLIIADNGKGIPENLVRDQRKSLGLKMIHILSKQLGGTCSIKSYSGVTIRLEFSEEKLVHSIQDREHDFKGILKEISDDQTGLSIKRSK